MREQDQAGHGFVVVELSDEAIQNLLDRQRLVGLRVVRPVAPVLAGAEEEHLDAGVSAVLVGGKDIGLFDALGVDCLIGGDMRQGPQAVAVFRGLLEFKGFGRLFHHVL